MYRAFQIAYEGDFRSLWQKVDILISTRIMFYKLKRPQKRLYYEQQLLGLNNLVSEKIEQQD